MSMSGIMFRISASRSDRKRDREIPIPLGVTQCRNIRYGPHSHWNLLDVYYPEDTREALPTIVSVHGGGYVYGTKEIYRRYCMDLAARGFAVVNFNYRLAPRWKFPTPLFDTNSVLEWVCQNAKRYHLDPERVILVGDSAGAQLASQYAAIWANAGYRRHFEMTLPPVNIRALGLNCGLYEPAGLRPGTSLTGLAKDYLGKLAFSGDPRLRVMESIGSNYPPSFVATAFNDFLRENARPMYEHLRSLGVPCAMECYGTPEDKAVGHVFHVNIRLPEAKRCNDDEVAFFRQFLQ